MAKEDLEKLIISYIDDKLDIREARKTQLMIEKDSGLMIDFKIQNFVKAQIFNEFKVSPVPDVFKKKIVKKINK